MDNNIISSIIERLKSSSSFSEDDSVDFGISGRTSVPFSDKNFHNISGKFNPDMKLAFIDGGNSEIFTSPSLCIHFVRIYHTIYNSNKRVSSGKDEFYVVVSAERVEGRLMYRADLLPLNRNVLTESFFESPFMFDSKDPNLSARNERVSIVQIPGLIRRSAELSTALLIQSDLKPDDALIIDGGLEYKHVDEEKLLDALKSVSKSKGIHICGISKTSNLLTKSGRPVAFVLDQSTELPIWFYHPVAEAEHEIVFVRFNHRSYYVFRLDSFSSPSELSGVFAALVENSVDPVFLGYPYGLIDADRFARVSNQEADCLKAMLFSKAGTHAELFRKLASTSDAHSILDNIL